MPTSTKVQFNLERLREQSLQAVEDQIANTEASLSALSDDKHFNSLVAAWREVQENRLLDLANRIRSEVGVDNYELANFRLDAAPERDKYEERDLKRRLISLEDRRARIMAKSGSLVPDAEGNISLTKTQLAEFFGL